ncbi:MAG: VWA domain-containing protein [Desulfobacteraceae bacterium]|nr:VWA domain-containing protein [Desulfobacteraceae bacterium]
MKFAIQKIAVFMVLFLVFGTGEAKSAGLLIADGGFGGVLEIREHEVAVTINNGIAVTHVTQVFHNTEKRQVEALYTFPVPKSASVSNFSMWINGKEMVGEVLEKQRARKIYNSYKQQRKDPGLLEQKDYKTFEMRIFPINADADQKVQITYYQELDIDHDQAVYVYPLATETRKNINSRTTGRFAISVEVKSAIPVTKLESPSHGNDFVVADHSDSYKLASLETASGSLASDVVINYDLERPNSGIDMITSKQDGEDGYFYLTLTAGKELDQRESGMDYVFVMDISGSMGNDGKLPASGNSVEAFIEELDENDRFEILTFNVRQDVVFGELQPASDDAKEQVKQYIRSQQARGGTVLDPALSVAYKYADPDRTLNVVVLSDGMTEQQTALLRMIPSRPKNARVFCIGVGNEVNRPLLEQLAEEAGGLSAFISRGDNFRRQAKAFRRKLVRPAATEVQMNFSGIRVYDIEPQKLPNLYHGSPLRLYGRYSGSGEGTLMLKANVLGREISRSAQLMFPGRDAGNPEIERMWALKRADRLLKLADRSGSRDRIIDDIVRLGEDYSIVTEYTSFLVLENDAEYRRWKIERRNMRRIQRDRDSQEMARKKLNKIRDKALSKIGPVKKETIIAKAPVSQHQVPNRQRTASPPASVREDEQSRNFSFGGGGGGGPVGPLFLAIAYWMRRKKSGRKKM